MTPETATEAIPAEAPPSTPAALPACFRLGKSTDPIPPGYLAVEYRSQRFGLLGQYAVRPDPNCKICRGKVEFRIRRRGGVFTCACIDRQIDRFEEAPPPAATEARPLPAPPPSHEAERAERLADRIAEAEAEIAALEGKRDAALAGVDLRIASIEGKVEVAKRTWHQQLELGDELEPRIFELRAEEAELRRRADRLAEEAADLQVQIDASEGEAAKAKAESERLLAEVVGARGERRKVERHHEDRIAPRLRKLEKLRRRLGG